MDEILEVMNRCIENGDTYGDYKISNREELYELVQEKSNKNITTNGEKKK